MAGCEGREVSPQEGPLEAVPPPGEPLGTNGVPRDRTLIRTENLGLRLTDEVTVHIPRLHGELAAVGEGPPDLADRNSYRIDIFDAEIRLSGADLSRLINDILLGYEDPPIRDVAVEVREGDVVLTGALQRPLPVQATIVGTLRVTEAGDVALQPSELEAAGIPVANLLDLIGVQLEELVSVRHIEGISIVENTLIIDPEALVPAPQLRGRVSGVRATPGQAVLFLEGTEGTGDAPRIEPPEAVENYLFVFGGDVRIGKFKMEGADLLLRDANPDDLFDLNLRDYRRQLVAGWVDFHPDMGIVAHLPDYAAVIAKERAAAP